MSFLLLVDEETQSHDPGPGMPERPRRIEVCKRALSEAGVQPTLGRPQAATLRDLQRAHRPAYLKRLETFCARGGGWIDADTSAGPKSYEVASRAAGACCTAVDEALGRGARSFCLVRPPGHHATSDQAMGFCLINNVAVAASHALHAGADKVMIVDWDVHHGNGTQEIFWTDPRVLYLSVHQWPWYPWTTGDAAEIGEGQGEGYNVNVPLPEGCGDEIYEQAFETLVLPIARQYRPDLIMVSAGFDAHLDDPLSSQRVTSDGFGRMSAAMRRLADEICDGRLVLALEGGYSLDALAESVVEAVLPLASPNPPEAVGRPAGPESVSDILQPVISSHADRWDLFS